MNCNCIEQLDALIKKDIDPEGELITVVRVNLNSGKGWASLPPIYFMARRKNKDGKFVGRPTKRHFAMMFCPMCGVKI